MRRLPPAQHATAIVFRLVCALVTAFALSPTVAHAQFVVGPNVNMVGAPGYVDPVTGEIVNDPTLNRQNEPSHAFSTRNPCHILAGANDYRLVDFEVPLVGDERADAWLGVFKSFDCGRTWTSTPHPGHQLDLTVAGQASPIFGRHAAADPTVRALPGGRFLYSGLAFDRAGVAQVFVSLFEDRNNKDGGDSIDWLGTTLIDSGQSGQFLDKPWSATTKDGKAFLAYTIFLGSGNNVHTQIKVSKFNGTSWSQPQKVSESVARNQGTTVAVDPGTGHVYVAWREFTDPRDSIVVVRSTDGGQTFGKAQRIEPIGSNGQSYRLSPFDQDASAVTFRTFSYPTMAIVPAVAEGRAATAPGRVYVAWAARGFVPLRSQGPGQTSTQTLGDARIVYSTSLDGSAWTYPRVADDSAERGHQLMPALATAGGWLALAYYDLRADNSLTFDDQVVEYGLAALQSCMAQRAGNELFNVVQCMIAVPSTVVPQRRHTLDVRAAVADGACLASGACTLNTLSALSGNEQISRYLVAYTGGTTPQQKQFNAPNLPLFKKGTIAFIGDYIDIQGLDYVPDGQGGWAYNTGAAASSPTPVFMVTWADNRNVRYPRGTGLLRGWENFVPINNSCEPGQNGIRNQDIYSAVLRPGMSVSAPLNARKIGDLQRSFPIVVANNTPELRHYQIAVGNLPAGIVASFDQFAGFGVGTPVSSLLLSIPPRSTATRTLFVLKGDASQAQHLLVPVVVSEVGGAGGTDTVWLNPDLSNPDAADGSVATQEVHEPVLGEPTLQTFTNTPDIRTPDFETPDFETPDFETPDFETPDFETPDFETPDFETPDFETPDFETPDFETPDFETPDFETATVGDVSWKVTNTGNVTSAYKPNVNIQDGKVGVRYQLVVRTITVQSLTSAISCKPSLLPQNQMLVNIVDPNVQSALTGLTSADFNNADPKNATFTLSSMQSAVITLRAYCQASAPGANGPGGCVTEGPLPLTASGKPLVAVSAVAQAANCQRCVGAACTTGDFVGNATECTLDDGLPKDVYDPIPPVLEVLNPTLTAPETTFVANDANNNGTEPVSFSLRATDNVALAAVTCTSPTSVSLVGQSGDTYTFAGVFPVGTTGITCSASDINSSPAPNTAAVNFLVTVNDVTAPTFDLPPGSTPGAPFGPSNPAEATSPAGATVTYTNPTATDSNGGPVSVTCGSAGGLQSGSTFPIGTTPINCVATDESGVSTPPTNLFDIAVADTTAPVITLNGAASLTIQLGTAYVDAGATAYDAVSGSVAVSNVGTVNTNALGTYTIDYSATDAAGNTATTSRTVIVADTIPPVITENATPNVLLWSPNKIMTPVTVSGVITDASPITATFKVIDEYGKIQPQGAITLGAGGAYSFVVSLEAYRNGNDSNGRVYTIEVMAVAAGQTSIKTTTVLVPHNQ